MSTAAIKENEPQGELGLHVITGPFPKGIGWIATLLLLIVTISISVVYSTYVTRGKISSLQGLQIERDQLSVEWSQLVLEQNSLGSYARVEKEAGEQLHMFVPVSQEIMMVKRTSLINSGVASSH